MFLISLNTEIVIIIQKIAPQAKSGKYYQIWFFPRFGGKDWRRSEHAHASYPGLFFHPPGFSPYMGLEERRVQGLDYHFLCSIPALSLLFFFVIECSVLTALVFYNKGMLEKVTMLGTQQFSDFSISKEPS